VLEGAGFDVGVIVAATVAVGVVAGPSGVGLILAVAGAGVGGDEVGVAGGTVALGAIVGLGVGVTDGTVVG
jgi:hypothetical protein